MNILLIGKGAFGKNYIPTVQSLNHSIKAYGRDWETYKDKPDGVIIATPPSSHIELAEYWLSKHIPVMIEKPVTTSSSELEKLSKYCAPILINHIHLFSDNYQTIRQESFNNKIKHIISGGYNFGPYRDYSSMWDYGSHDISMILDLLQDYPTEIDVIKSITSKGELFSIDLKFNDIHTFSVVGNGAEIKHRNLLVEFSDKKMRYKDSDNKTPPLTNAVKTFCKLIDGRSDYRSGIKLARKVTKLLSFCEKSLIQPS